MHIYVLYRQLQMNLRALILHISFWIFYVSLELYVLYNYSHQLDAPWVYIIFYAINIGLCYGILWSLNIENTKGQDTLAIPVRCLAVFACYLLCKWIANYYLYHTATPVSSWESFKTFAASSFLRGAVFIFPAIFYRMSGYLSDYKKRFLIAEKVQLTALKEKAELQANLAESRNAYLQQQLNPHLLFNALNFVYSRVFKHSADGARALQLLTEILRYTISESGADGKTDLPAEITQIENLIEINRFRYDTPLQLDVRIENIGGDERILPLILLTLTENIFKHGNLRDPVNRALLEIRQDESGALFYHSHNLKKSRSDHTRSSQIGLKNIRIRLDFAYPGKYDLAIHETDDFFTLTLKLIL